MGLARSRAGADWGAVSHWEEAGSDWDSVFQLIHPMRQ